MPDFPKVIKVVPTDDFFVHIYFDDGCRKIYNANEIIKKGAFTPLQDINIFKNTCCVIELSRKPLCSAWWMKGSFFCEFLQNHVQHIGKICYNLIEYREFDLASFQLQFGEYSR